MCDRNVRGIELEEMLEKILIKKENKEIEQERRKIEKKQREKERERERKRKYFIDNLIKYLLYILLKISRYQDVLIINMLTIIMI